LLVHLVPGDPVDYMLGETAATSAKDSLRHQLHLDRPLPEQYGLFLADLAGGRLQSLHGREAVAPLLARRLGWTLVLALTSMAVAVGIALPLGTLAAVKGGWVDRVPMPGALAGVPMPVSWLGPLLIPAFGLRLGWLP